MKEKKTYLVPASEVFEMTTEAAVLTISAPDVEDGGLIPFEEI